MLPAALYMPAMHNSVAGVHSLTAMEWMAVEVGMVHAVAGMPVGMSVVEQQHIPAVNLDREPGAPLLPHKQPVVQHMRRQLQLLAGLGMGPDLHMHLAGQHIHFVAVAGLRNLQVAEDRIPEEVHRHVEHHNRCCHPANHAAVVEVGGLQVLQYRQPELEAGHGGAPPCWRES